MVLNQDGTKNTTLTGCGEGSNISGIVDKPFPNHTGGDQILEQDKDAGKLTNPIQDQDKDEGKFVTPIPEVDQDDGKFVTPIPERDKNDGILSDPILGDEWQQNELISKDSSYEPNKGSVGNMGEFLGQPGFGSDTRDNSTKTSRQYQGQSIYTADKPIGDFIQKGDQFYLDGQHKNHIEVFDKRGNFKGVLNLDGSINKDKTEAGQGRRLPK